MRRFFAAMWVVVTCTLVPVSGDSETYSEGEDYIEGEEYSEADAEQVSLNCGTINIKNESHQFGDYAWLEYIVETRREANFSGVCGLLSLRVEANVVGVAGSGGVHNDKVAAVLRRQIPVPSYGDWRVSSSHYRVWSSKWVYLHSAGSSLASVRQKRTEEEESTEPTSDPEHVALAPEDPNNPNSNDPIIVDTGRNGYRLTSVADGVFFDIDADGAVDRVAWTDPDGDDEFLAFDRNGNGRIDDGSELLGNYTRVSASAPVTAANGFEALRMLEGPATGPSHIDEIIDARDTLFWRLLLWRDANHNGISEPGELRRAADAGLIAFLTDYKESRRRDPHGNEFRQRAKALSTVGEFYVYDVWLRSQ